MSEEKIENMLNKIEERMRKKRKEVKTSLIGELVSKELKKIDKNVKAILVSGFSKNDKAKEILDEGINAFIQKPFKLHELSKVIYDVIRK